MTHPIINELSTYFPSIYQFSYFEDKLKGEEVWTIRSMSRQYVITITVKNSYYKVESDLGIGEGLSIKDAILNYRENIIKNTNRELPILQKEENNAELQNL